MDDVAWWQERAFQFTSRDFNAIRSIVRDQTGISLSDAKKDLVYNRLVKRLRSLNLDNFRSYCRLICEHDSQEMHHLINAITTNLTAFFRESHHFTYLGNQLLPALIKKKNDKRIRIWSAGCSSGEEPYSIAIVLREALAQHPGWDARILATDLDSNVLDNAQRGIYSTEKLKGISKARLRHWFQKGKNRNHGSVRVKDTLRDIITFRQLNLMKPWPFSGPIDAIFCRNVVIYFDKPTQATLFNRYTDLLGNPGFLFLGHSETLFKVSTRFRPVGNTIYQITS